MWSSVLIEIVTGSYSKKNKKKYFSLKQHHIFLRWWKKKKNGIHTCWSWAISCVVIKSVKVCSAFRWKLDWSCFMKRSHQKKSIKLLVHIISSWYSTKILQITIRPGATFLQRKKKVATQHVDASNRFGQ